MSHHLIILPDDTAKPILDAVNGAKKSLNIRMFLFTDLGLVNAVITAKKRGVQVRVMLNPARRSGAFWCGRHNHTLKYRDVASRRRGRGLTN